MKTNELKKGDWVVLRNGWEAEMWDNMKGNTRVANVHGFETEAGSVYSHDIAYLQEGGRGGALVPIEHTPAQLKLRKQVAAFGM